MDIYLIERNDSVGYDEYDASVIIANSEDEALQILKEKHGEHYYSGWRGYDVTVSKIDLSQKGIVLESFNAG